MSCGSVWPVIAAAVDVTARCRSTPVDAFLYFTWTLLRMGALVSRGVSLDCEAAAEANTTTGVSLDCDAAAEAKATTAAMTAIDEMEELCKPWESQEARDAYPLGLVAACVARTAELGFEGMYKQSDRDRDRADFRRCYQEAVGVAVAELPGLLETDYEYRGLIHQPGVLKKAWPLRDYEILSLRDKPSFSDAPSLGEKIAWQNFYNSFSLAYSRRITRILQGQFQATLRHLAASIEASTAELNEELRARLAGGVDSLTLAGLRKDCKDRDLAVSGTKGKLFERLQGYLDGGGHAPRRKRRRRWAGDAPPALT